MVDPQPNTPRPDLPNSDPVPPLPDRERDPVPRRLIHRFPSPKILSLRGRIRKFCPILPSQRGRSISKRFASAA